MIRLAIIEDNLLIRDRLKEQFKNADQFECVIAVESVEKFLRYYRTTMCIDIILLDINLPGMSGIAGIPRLLSLESDWKIIMFTVYQDADKIFKAICAGATGYLLKDINEDELEQQLLSIQEKGGAILSPQIARRVLDYFQPKRKKQTKIDHSLNEKELQIVRFLVDGLSYQEVGDKIGISLNGIRYHIKNIYKKLQVRSKSELLNLYVSGFFKKYFLL